MNPIEFAVSMLAPHLCLVCRREGSVLCDQCAISYLHHPSPCCYRCNRLNDYSQTCVSCAANSPIYHVWVACQYMDCAKEVVAMLKFQRAKAASKVIAACMDRRLPALPLDTLISAIPTANKRVRMRGYDQSRLIAKEFAQLRGMQYRDVLRRATSTRQVGAGRTERFEHLKMAFEVPRPGKLPEKILLIDDVLTTGATLESAANILDSHGVSHIDAAVFAH